MGDLLINMFDYIRVGLDRQPSHCSETLGFVAACEDNTEYGKENIEENIETEMGRETFLVARCVRGLENLF